MSDKTVEYYLDKLDEKDKKIEQLEDEIRSSESILFAKIDKLEDQIRQMLNVPEYARNHLKDKCIAELDAQLDALKLYTMHDEDCSKTMIKRRCSCGLDAALNGEGK